MSYRQRRVSIAICAGCAAIALMRPSASAQPRTVALPPIVGVTDLYQRQDSSGLSLLGFDPVTYFLSEGPKPGSSAIEVLWNGTAWRFASEANRDAFRRDPEAYAPRIGGYDAVAATRGLVVDADPGLFVVRAGRLYLFRNDHNRARFLADPALADQAETRWPELRRDLVLP